MKSHKRELLRRMARVERLYGVDVLGALELLIRVDDPDRRDALREPINPTRPAEVRP